MNKHIKLILVLTKLLDYIEKDPGATDMQYAGLCATKSHALDTIEEQELFIDYWWKCSLKRKIFYTYEGKKTTDYIMFGWLPYAKEPRVKWLKQRIKALNK